LLIILLRAEYTELHQIWGGHSTIIFAAMHILDFRYIALFRNQSASNGRVENRSQISNFPTPVKIREGVGKMSESTFQAQPRTQFLIYFWRGTAA